MEDRSSLLENSDTQLLEIVLGRPLRASPRHPSFPSLDPEAAQIGSLLLEIGQRIERRERHG